MFEAAIVLGKRKVTDLKEALGKLGFSTKANARKAELETRLQQAQDVLALKEAEEDHVWSRDEYDVFVKELIGLTPEEWDPGAVYLIRNTYNLRFFSADVTGDVKCMQVINEIENYYTKTFASPVKQKTKIISADSIAAEMQRLLAKQVEKWGNREGDMLVSMFSDVKGIDANTSLPCNLEKYRKLNDLLSVFYQKRPDIKQRVDPEILTFDLSGAMQTAAINAGGAPGNNGWVGTVAAGGPGAAAAAVAAVGVIDLYLRSRVAYPANNFPVAVNAGPAALPGKSNPGPVPLTFVFANVNLAHHFLGWMQNAVPGIQATITSSPNAPIVYN